MPINHPMTTSDLTTEVTTTLDPINTCTATTVADRTAGTALSVDFTPINTSMEITDDSLNQTARTLRDSINTNLASLNTGSVSVMNALIADINSTISLLTTCANSKYSIIYGNLQQLAASANDAQDKLAALDDLFGTDSDIANKVTIINNLISNLESSGGDAINAINLLISAINGLPLIYRKTITISNHAGTYTFINSQEGIASGDYICSVDAIENPKVAAFVMDKTDTQFTIVAKSNGVHYVPQPAPCDGAVGSSTAPVSVVVFITVVRPPLVPVPTPPP